MGNTAIITGAAKRIGRAIARHLAKNGWNIIIHFNKSEIEASNLFSELKFKYPEQSFNLVKADLSKSVEVEGLIENAINKFGGIDLLINNASVFEPSNIKNSSSETFDLHFKINFRSPFILTRDYANFQKSGIIINLTDTRVVNNFSDFACYSLSKKALWELTKMSALELGPDIRINAIAPGLAIPPADEDEYYLLKLSEKIAMKRPGGIEPILKSIDYIIQNEYLTGQILFCDGGENLGIKK